MKKMIPEYVKEAIGIPIKVTPSQELINEVNDIIGTRQKLNQPINNFTFTRILNALMLERGFAKLINGKKNPLEYDYSNPETYAYDVVGPNNEHFEVKRKKDRTFKWVLDGHKGKIDLTSFKKHQYLVDYIIGGNILSVDKDTNTYTIVYDFVANAKNFFDYQMKSKYNSEYMYKSMIAMRRGDCYE